MTPRPVDRGRQAAYDAERFAFEGSWLMTRQSSDDAIAMARRVVASPAWRRVVPEPIEFATAAGSTSWCTGALAISFAPSTEIATVAHELAHAATFHRCAGAAGHGPEWRGWFVTVMAMLHGDEAAAGLAEAFAVYGLAVRATNVEYLGAPLIGLPGA